LTPHFLKRRPPYTDPTLIVLCVLFPNEGRVSIYLIAASFGERRKKRNCEPKQFFAVDFSVDTTLAKYFYLTKARIPQQQAITTT
jgi:hypothetical protein